MNIMIKVLVVDDSLDIRERVTVVLQETGNVEVIGQAGEVSGAILMIRALRPDVVILDIGLPDGNGFDVIESLRKDAYSPAFVVLTNYFAEQYRQRALQLGVRYFFDKSSELWQMSSTLRSLTASGDFDASRVASTGDF